MLIGITGTIGAGKGTVVEYLVEQKGFTHISARSIWTLELEARGLEVNRDTMTALANQLRAEHGPAYFVERALEEVTAGTKTVIESIRTLGEVELLKARGGILLGVTADRELRFARVTERGSQLDNISYEDFVRQEEAEMNNDDPTKQNIAAVLAAADFVITNEGTLEDLQAQVESILDKLRHVN